MSAPPTSHTPYRELTVAAMVLGVLQGVVMTAAFVYIGLKLGFGLPGSTVAAIMGFVVLRGIMGKGTIVENNVNQTVASGINTASAGVVFTLPALLLMSVKRPELADFSVPAMLAAAVAGSFMGIVVIIPLRKQFIELDRLRFPTGTAVATILRSPGEGAAKAKLLIIGSVSAAIGTVLVNLGLIAADINLNALGVPAYVPLAISVSFANLGAGLLSGRGGLPFFLGGALAWWVISPVVTSLGWLPTPLNAPDTDAVYALHAGIMYGEMIRPLGIGMLIGGALAGVVAAYPSLKAALASLSAAAKTAGESGNDAEELSPTALYVGLGGSVVALFFASLMSDPGVTVGTALVMAIAGTLWLAVAGLIVAQATGATDISPLSGLALIAVTLLFAITGGNIVASVLIGVTVCIASNQCADMMSDLKTGHLIGSRPRAQQVAQFMVAWIGPIVAIGVMFLLWQQGGESGGFGPQSTACAQGLPNCLPAPQAGALQGMIESLESGKAPLDKYLAGAVLGGALSAFPIGGLGVLVGLAMYLPFNITFGYGIGCLGAMGLQRRFGVAWIGDKLVPLAAGFIIGEALTNLVWTMVQLAFPDLGGGGGH